MALGLHGRTAIVCASILVTNNGDPRPGRFADWGRDEWLGALDGGSHPGRG